LQYAYLPVLGYPDAEWHDVWNGTEVSIDNCLFLQTRALRFCYAFEELEFVNIPYRLIINPDRAHDIPKLGRGNIISFNNCNTSNYRYIIERCVFANQHHAFLRVVCFTPDQDMCSLTSRRPPFILQIPVTFCLKRRYHLINPYKCSIELENIGNSKGPKYYTHDEEEESTSLVASLICRVQVRMGKYIVSFRITASDPHTGYGQ
jgi:hypothetical protein